MSEEDATYDLSEPFDIDSGELDTSSREQAFVLGYEMAQVHALMHRGQPFRKLIHAANVERVKRSAIRRRMRVTVEPNGEGWAVAIHGEAEGS